MSIEPEEIESEELFAALQAQDLKKLDELLSQGKELPTHIEIRSGWSLIETTPLKMACDLGNLEMVKLLIEKGKAVITSNTLSDIFRQNERIEANSAKRFENNRIIEYIQKQFFIQKDEELNETLKAGDKIQAMIKENEMTYAQFVEGHILDILNTYFETFKEWDHKYITKLLENIDKNTASILNGKNEVSAFFEKRLERLISNLGQTYPPPYIDDQLRALHNVGVPQPASLDNQSPEIQTRFHSKFYTERVPEAPTAPFPTQSTEVSQASQEASQSAPDSKFSDESRQRVGSIAEAFSAAADRKREEETLSSEATAAGRPVITQHTAVQERRKSISGMPAEEPAIDESLKGPGSGKSRKV